MALSRCRACQLFSFSLAVILLQGCARNECAPASNGPRSVLEASRPYCSISRIKELVGAARVDPDDLLPLMFHSKSAVLYEWLHHEGDLWLPEPIDTDLGAFAIIAAGKLRLRESVPYLTSILAFDISELRRVLAAQALGRIGDAEPFDLLALVAERERAIAAASAGEPLDMAVPRHPRLSPLFEFNKHEAARVAGRLESWCRRAMSSIEAESAVVPELVKWLEDENPWVVCVAIQEMARRQKWEALRRNSSLADDARTLLHDPWGARGVTSVSAFYQRTLLHEDECRQVERDGLDPRRLGP